jgi:putative pyruvate formate lyase activating enzyme
LFGLNSIFLIILKLATALSLTILTRYVKLVKDNAVANFRIIKKIEFNPNKNHSIEDLWKIHSRLMLEFLKIREKLDKRTIKIEKLKNPKNSLFDLKIKLTEEIMKSCELCERKCNVNRMEYEKGFCKVGKECSISSEFIHMGEEAHISPSHTIFFMGCTLDCQFCQNWLISKWYEGMYKTTPEKLAIRIERRRKEGARNLNLVGGEPTSSLLCILKTLKFCSVNIPVIWNSNFYMSEKTMKILDGIVDMFLSDFKYGNNKCGLRLSKISNYFDICSRNHLIATKNTETTIRHLILPNHLECCTKSILKWIHDNIKDKVIVNIMDQYRPEHKAHEYPDINRRLNKEEIKEAINYAEKLGINYIK